VLGAGLRGRGVYGAHARLHPERLRVVALAEPDDGRREAMAAEHGLAGPAVCRDWTELLARPQQAELAIVATGDTLHVEPALAALARGYHVLLEKPIAPDPVDCVRVVQAAEAAGRMLQIGHVLRFTPFYTAVHEIVSSGRLGRLLHLDLREHVSTWHMVHSFVRGKFRSRAVAAPFLLAKSCHDLDLLVWLAGRDPLRVSSFGALSGYCAANAPEGAPPRCSDGCPVQERCPHDAVRFYAGPDDALARGWPWSDVSLDPSREARRRALETGPYGRCVYRCDNDVVDHQTVAVDFGDGLTGSFAVHGHAWRECRNLRITGSEGELRGQLESGELEITRHGSLDVERRRLEAAPIGHFGGDAGLLAHVLGALGRADDDTRASGRTALAGHLLGFAAECAREEGRVVDVTAFARQARKALA
jgi:predicted dehydrogenase